jgi:8-oxo-dGDP phosphatase
VIAGSSTPDPTSADPAVATPGFDVVASRQEYRGKVFGLRVDEVRMPDGAVAVREVVEHPGAVAVVALDEAGGVVLIRQYRHPAGGYLVELPAGLLDVPGEAAVATARRELFEEAGLRADRWHTLVDVRTSPGMTDEAARVFLARDLSDVPDADRHVGVEEETDLGVHRVDLDRAVTSVLAGEIENALAVAGLLAAVRARDDGWAGLRPADAPWPARPGR